MNMVIWSFLDLTRRIPAGRVRDKPREAMRSKKSIRATQPSRRDGNRGRDERASYRETVVVIEPVASFRDCSHRLLGSRRS